MTLWGPWTGSPEFLQPQNSCGRILECAPFPSPGDIPTQGIWVFCITISRAWIPKWWMAQFPISPVQLPTGSLSIHTIPLSFLFPLFWWFTLLSRFSNWQVSSLWMHHVAAVHRPCYDDGIVGCIFSVIRHNLDGSFSFLEGLIFAFILNLFLEGNIISVISLNKASLCYGAEYQKSPWIIWRAESIRYCYLSI